MSDVNLQISQQVINGIVQEKIKSEVAASLAQVSHQLIEQLAQNVLKSRVETSSGQLTTSTYNSMPILDYMMHKEIKRLAEEQIKDSINKIGPMIKKKVEEALKKNAGKFASDLTSKLVSQTESSIKYKLDVSTTEFSDYTKSEIQMLKKEIEVLKNRK